MKFGRRVRKPALWGEYVGENEVDATVVCGPLMDANGGLSKLDLGAEWFGKS